MITFVLALAAAAAAGDSAAPAAADSLARPVSDSVTAPAPPRDSVPLPFRLVPLAVLAAREGAPAVVDQPAGLAVDAFGRVLLSDSGRHRIQQLEPGGAPRWQTGTLGSADGEMRRPSSLVPLGTLEIAVLDVENRRVVTFDLFGHPRGVRVDLAALEAADPVGRIDAIALSADRGGAMVLADAERDRVVAFDFAGQPTATIGGIGSRPGSFRGLRGLAVTPRGELVTAERGNARVQRLTAGGRAIESWPLPVRPGRARLPVAADDSGRVAVADEAGGRLWLFARGGRLLAALTGLEGPSALAFSGDRELLVAEARAGRVRRFRIEPAASPER